MSDGASGLNCPRCGGMVPIPEGTAVVGCPFCELRSVVRGERGLRRYQITSKIDRDQAEKSLTQFFSSSMAIARDIKSRAKLTDVFLAYLPFWMVWGKAMAYAFGQKKVGSGEHQHYEPREVRIVEEMTWNSAACDVGEFGVNSVPLSDQQTLEPFRADALHAAGMVFEPVGSVEQVWHVAETEFENRVRAKGHLDRLSQLFYRTTRHRIGLVYYPLWVIRYLYQGRSFQVVVDGTSGSILYGKAPGNTLYRAAVLVGGMIAGAFLSVDVASFFLSMISHTSDDSGQGLLAAAGIAFVGGLALMFAAYRKFRYGEHYEFRSGPREDGFEAIKQMASQIEDPESLIRTFTEGGNPWQNP